MGAAYKSHWIMNLLRVTGDRTVVNALAARPDVAQIIGNPWVKSSLLPKTKLVATPNHADTPEWNITKVKAPQVWAHGFTGQGIVLGDIDTGQQWDHPALKNHYRGWNGSSVNHNYNWYDETNPANRVPVDEYHHGTGTAGIMVGDDGAGNQIGVAPGAKWMACRSMNASGLGTPDTYIGCLEFMVAPWDLNGQNPDPSMAPVAVNNSWYCGVPSEGCTQGTLLPAVQNMRAAGIVPVFAAGNEGPSCDTVGDVGPPAQYDESYTVGATTMQNTLAIFSSRGPAHVPGKTLIKPDISAPGQTIRSSEPTNQYQTGDGTSFAAPHITGIIALIYSAKPNLIGDVDATEDLINHTAHHINTSDCSSSGTFPNNLYGWGFVNAAAASRP
jgi:subtilisin family serine protease